MSDLIEVRRAKFEAQIKILNPDDSAQHGDKMFEWNGATYVWTWVNWDWLLWNAALDSAVVELPNSDKAMLLVLGYQENINTNVTGTANWAVGIGAHIVSACADAIHAAGVPTQ